MKIKIAFCDIFIKLILFSSCIIAKPFLLCYNEKKKIFPLCEHFNTLLKDVLNV